jgi:hypothetical protein
MSHQRIVEKDASSDTDDLFVANTVIIRVLNWEADTSLDEGLVLAGKESRRVSL